MLVNKVVKDQVSWRRKKLNIDSEIVVFAVHVRPREIDSLSADFGPGKLVGVVRVTHNLTVSIGCEIVSEREH